MKTFSFFKVLSRKMKIYFLLTCCLAIIGSFFDIFSIGFAVTFIIYLLGGDIPEALKEALLFFGISDIDLTFGLIFVAILMLLKLLFTALSIWVQASFAYACQKSFSFRIFNYYLSQDFEKSLHINSGEKVTDATKEVDLFVQNYLIALLSMISELSILFAIFFGIMLSSPSLLIKGLFTVSLIIVSFKFFITPIVSSLGKIRQTTDQERVELLVQSFRSLKDISIYDLFPKVLAQYKEVNDTNANANKMTRFIQNIPKSVIEFFMILGVCIFIAISLNSGKSSTEIISFMIVLTAIIFKLLPSLIRIFSNLTSLNFSYPSSQKVRLLLNTINEPNYQDTAQVGKGYFNNWDLIEFISIDKSLGSKKIINNLSFSIAKGERIAIVGPSGSGKTTLSNIISGLLSPNKGKILLDNKEVNLTNSSWRNNISYVPQDYFVFNATIDENITLLDKTLEPNTAFLEDAYRISNLNEMTHRSSKEILGEGGNTLSGGQKQRLSIARSIYRRGQIFILDEPTSSLDKDNAKRIISKLMIELPNTTFIVITHDNEIASLFDRKISLN